MRFILHTLNIPPMKYPFRSAVGELLCVYRTGHSGHGMSRCTTRNPEYNITRTLSKINEYHPNICQCLGLFSELIRKVSKIPTPVRRLLKITRSLPKSFTHNILKIGHFIVLKVFSGTVCIVPWGAQRKFWREIARDGDGRDQ